MGVGGHYLVRAFLSVVSHFEGSQLPNMFHIQVASVAHRTNGMDCAPASLWGAHRVVLPQVGLLYPKSHPLDDLGITAGTEKAMVYLFQRDVSRLLSA
jgi:hypothetical protein